MISLDLQKLRDLRLEPLRWKHIWKNIYRFEHELTSIKDKSVHIPLDMSGTVAVYPDGTIEHAEFGDLIHRFLIEDELSELRQKEQYRLNSLLSLNPGFAIALTSIERNVNDSEESLFPVQIKHEDGFTLASIPIWIKEKPSLPQVIHWEYK